MLVFLASCSPRQAVPDPSRLSSPPPTVDAAVTASEPFVASVPVDAPPLDAPAVVALVDAPGTTCSSHYNLLPDANVLLGMTEAEVRCSIGEPHTISGATWRHRLPHDCSEIEDDVTVVFSNRRVVRASSTRRRTGKFCM